MTNEQIIKYNQMCAKFMGYNVIKEPLIIDGNCVWHKGNHASFPDNTLIEPHLVYDSDWRWIMEVVEKIQLLDIVHDNTRSYDNVYKEWQCTFSPSYKTHDFGYTVGKSKTSEKHAVIDAINQFLIWHEQNNNPLNNSLTSKTH